MEAGNLCRAVSIGITNGKIIVMDTSKKVDAKKVIDGAGKFLIPGLFECHMHTGNFERDFPRLYRPRILA